MIIIGYNDPVTITVARLHLDRARMALEKDLARATVHRLEPNRPADATTPPYPCRDTGALSFGLQ